MGSKKKKNKNKNVLTEVQNGNNGRSTEINGNIIQESVPLVVPTNQTETAVEEPKVEQEPEQQQAVQAAVEEQVDDGGWEAVPTKPKKGKNKTNQKDNKGQGQQKGKDVKSKKVA